MRELSALLSCPVCLGVTMEKASIGAAGDLQVDHCRRCGGAWLEHGEVQLLRARGEDSLRAAVPRRDVEFRMRCHDCHSLMERAAEACPSCGWNNALDCPACAGRMRVESHQGLRLDVCRDCRGVWFDHHELGELWRESFDRTLRLRGGRTRGALGEAGEVAGDVLLHSIFFAPDLLFYGARAGGEIASASAGAVANLPAAIGAAPEAAAAAVEVVGEAAGGVFDVIVAIISGIFDSF